MGSKPVKLSCSMPCLSSSCRKRQETYIAAQKTKPARISRATHWMTSVLPVASLPSMLAPPTMRKRTTWTRRKEREKAAISFSASSASSSAHSAPAMLRAQSARRKRPKSTAPRMSTGSRDTVAPCRNASSACIPLKASRAEKPTTCASRWVQHLRLRSCSSRRCSWSSPSSPSSQPWGACSWWASLAMHRCMNAKQATNLRQSMTTMAVSRASPESLSSNKSSTA
mmetsp:Transcript_98552/g.287516  ORF Transcript_98552/g.287516 Transcript_98552/m.287516 type:complete len:226 (+) Transcript_98552:656-1333(+)